LSDDEPIYDHVASDDDYYHIPESIPSKLSLKQSTTSSPSKSRCRFRQSSSLAEKFLIIELWKKNIKNYVQLKFIEVIVDKNNEI
jgi:hypothetical protein